MVLHCISNSHFPTAMLILYLLVIHMFSLIKCLQKAFVFFFFFLIQLLTFTLFQRIFFYAFVLYSLDTSLLLDLCFANPVQLIVFIFLIILFKAQTY